MKKYTTQELNEILINKKVEDFYIVITQELNDEFPTEERANEMLNNAEMSEDTEKNLVETSEEISKLLPGFAAGDINRLLFAFCEVNHRAVITKVDDETLYDVCTFRFIDLNKEKVVRFDKLSDFYNNDNARPLLFQPEQLHGLVTEPSVTIDYDDLSAFNEHGKYAHMSYEGVDLTEEFIKVIGLRTGTPRRRS